MFTALTRIKTPDIPITSIFFCSSRLILSRKTPEIRPSHYSDSTLAGQLAPGVLQVYRFLGSIALKAIEPRTFQGSTNNA